MRKIKILGRYASVFLVLTVFILPMIWVFINSFKPTTEIMSSTLSFFPKNFTLIHYYNLFSQVNFGGYYFNSLLVALSTSIITVLLAAFAGYSVLRCQYPGRQRFFQLFLISYIFPKVLLLMPLYLVFSKINIIDNPIALIIIHVTLTAPFSVWLLRGYFDSIPKAIEEAAMIDGATRIQTLFKVFIPLAAPGLAAVAINAFLMSWSEYLFASVFIISDKFKTLPYGMSFFLQQYSIDWGIMLAGSVLIALPPIVGFAVAGRYFIQGLTAGSIK